jgi:hypothetical protein
MYTFHEEIKNLIGINDIDFIHKDDLKIYFQEKYNKIPISILFLWTIDEDLYNKIRIQLPNTKIIIWTDDLHWYDKKIFDKNYFTFKNADYILCRYSYFKEFYNLYIENKLIKYNHSCNLFFFKENINFDSENKIYMYGAASHHYKLRLEFLERMQKYKDKLVIKHHPGYECDGNIETINTSEELHKYSFAFTSGAFPVFEIPETSVNMYYLIGKFFEIAGSGVLLLCNDYGVKEELNELGFFDMIHYINIHENNFDFIIKWLFDNKNIDKINEIRKNGHNLIKEKYTTKKLIEYINKILEKKLK